MFHVDLSTDHPGFHDLAYRRRRDTIARSAERYPGDGRIPDAPYSAAEHAVWRQVLAALTPQHRRFAAREVQALLARFPLPRERIPQLEQVSQRLRAASGIRLRPVTGLVPPREFFRALADGTFLAAQYIRHASRPWFTPEPDVIHELVGHAALLADRRLAALSRRFGRVAAAAAPAALTALERVYWFTLEFGLVRCGGEVRAVGSGLLSSVQELEHATRHAEHLPWDLSLVAATPYSPTDLQPRLFVAPSFAAMLRDVDDWLARGFAVGSG